MHSTDFTLRLELRYVEPKVWRRVMVSGDFVLSDLHHVIQMLFDWDDAHLWQFEFGKDIYAPDIGGLDDFTPAGKTSYDADETLLEEALGSRKKFLYTYDFGDDWQIDIAVESRVDAEAAKVPVCLDGARAGPPDDMGGPPGYAHFCEVMADVKHPEHGEMKDWIDGEWDAEAFDLRQSIVN
jgi:Plasmid pRiA4b ORF-3-like protein